MAIARVVGGNYDVDLPKVQELRLLESEAMIVSGMTLVRSISLQTPCFGTVVDIAQMNSINTTRHQIEVAVTLIIRWVVTNTHPFLDSATCYSVTVTETNIKRDTEFLTKHRFNPSAWWFGTLGKVN